MTYVILLSKVNILFSALKLRGIGYVQKETIVFRYALLCFLFSVFTFVLSNTGVRA